MWPKETSIQAYFTDIVSDYSDSGNFDSITFVEISKVL